MSPLPPLECLTFFGAAARHESFARAAAELGATPGVVVHRIRILEKHLRDTLFERDRRGDGAQRPGQGLQRQCPPRDQAAFSAVLHREQVPSYGRL